MEVYIGPPEAKPDAALSRRQVLAALSEAGLVLAKVEEKAGAGHSRARWILSFQGSDAGLEFQETDAGLVFATLEQSMLDTSDYPDRICGALESLGWEVDQENVG
jgi:hypothetical protein